MLEHVNVLFDFFSIFGQRIRLWRFSKVRAMRSGRSFSFPTRMEAVYPTTNQYKFLFPKQLLRHLTISCAHIVTRECQFQFDENDLVMTMNVILAFGCCLWYHPWMLNWRSSVRTFHTLRSPYCRAGVLTRQGAAPMELGCLSCVATAGRFSPPDGDIYSIQCCRFTSLFIVQQYNYEKTSS